MGFLIPVVLILFVIIWFLILAIMDKNKKGIIKVSIILIIYVVIATGGIFLIYTTLAQFIK